MGILKFAVLKALLAGTITLKEFPSNGIDTFTLAATLFELL